MSAIKKKLTIKNYEKFVNAAHPEFSCMKIGEHSNYYYIGIKRDTSDDEYIFKLSRNPQKYFDDKYDVGMTWIENGTNMMESITVDRDDLVEPWYLFNLFCEIIKDRTTPNFPF